MTFLFLIAVLGGAASVLTPCVLPLLPALLVVSGSSGARRVWGVVVGVELSFFIIAIALAGAISSLGLPADVLQFVAAGLLAVFGIVLIVPKLHDAFTTAVSRLTGRIPQRGVAGAGFWPGFLSGLPLGLVWAPCAGPILAGITVAASTSRFTERTVITMSGYALGMIGPLAAVVFGGQRLSALLRRALGGGRRVLAPMGVIMLATSVLIGAGGLNKVNRFIAERINLTSTPTAALERDALTSDDVETGDVRLSRDDLELNGYPALGHLADLGRAPDVEGISRWYNTEPISIASLRGKVVLIDFWTYSCINCIRTFPYLRRWDDKYRDQGFVLLGVHSPEFEFEKDPGNVGRAVEDFGIEYPVALDPKLETWRNFYNQYWPAHYLIDRNGHIRSVHYGEGAYARTENEIRKLLGMKANVSTRDPTLTGARTPETYLGYSRAMRYQGTVDGTRRFVKYEATYEAPRESRGDVDLGPDHWSYDGEWTVGPESALAGDDAQVYLHFRAKKVFIVAGGRNGTITVDGKKVLVVNESRLFTVRSGDYANDVVRLDVSPGVSVYSFTFG